MDPSLCPEIFDSIWSQKHLSEKRVAHFTAELLRQLRVEANSEAPYEHVRSHIWHKPKTIPLGIRLSLVKMIGDLGKPSGQDGSQWYTFSQAIGGSKRILEFVERSLVTYQRVADELDQAQQEFKKRNQRRDFECLIVAPALALAASYLSPPVASSAAETLPLFASSLLTFFTPPVIRLFEHMCGDPHYHQHFKNNESSRLASALEFIQDALHSTSSANYFLIDEFSALASAFQTLQGNIVFEELKRSCQTFSPQSKGDEPLACQIAHRLDQGTLNPSYLRASQNAEGEAQVVKGQIALAFFRDLQTGEPVLIYWVQAQLSPGQRGFSQSRREHQAEGFIAQPSY